MSSNNDSTEPTVESLTKKKEDFLTHGLDGTSLGDAVDRKADEKHDELTKHREIVEAEIAVQQARKHGVESEAVEALAETVESLSEETKAAALVEHAEEVEAREKIAELESLAGSTDGPAGKKFEQKAEALRSKHGLEDEDGPGRYSVEALEQDDDPDAEALADFHDRKQAEAQDDALPDDVQARLADLKQLRESASTPALRQMYQRKIDDLRAEHA